jgi:F-type H+-transporting ATPase subunit epsilon
MQVEFVTPKNLLFSEKADSILLPTEGGKIGILENHAPLLTKLTEGEVRIDGKRFEIEGGFSKVSDNKVIILAKERSRDEAE